MDVTKTIRSILRVVNSMKLTRAERQWVYETACWYKGCHPTEGMSLEMWLNAHAEHGGEEEFKHAVTAVCDAMDEGYKHAPVWRSVPWS